MTNRTLWNTPARLDKDYKPVVVTPEMVEQLKHNLELSEPELQKRLALFDIKHNCYRI